MKTTGRLTLLVAVLIVSMLACNLPGAGNANPPAGNTPTLPALQEAPAVTPTDTVIPPTSTPSLPPEITLTKNSNCRLGPSTYYVIIDQITENKVLPVIGRNDGDTWWQVVNPTGRQCWIFHENASANSDFSTVPIGDAPPLPYRPQDFRVTDQLCQPGPKIFTVSFGWSGGGGETSFRLFRDGKQLIEVKAGKYNYKDTKAPLNKNITYEIEAVNGNGISERAVQIVTACK